MACAIYIVVLVLSILSDLHLVRTVTKFAILEIIMHGLIQISNFTHLAKTHPTQMSFKRTPKDTVNILKIWDKSFYQVVIAPTIPNAKVDSATQGQEHVLVKPLTNHALKAQNVESVWAVSRQQRHSHFKQSARLYFLKEKYASQMISASLVMFVHLKTTMLHLLRGKPAWKSTHMQMELRSDIELFIMMTTRIVCLMERDANQAYVDHLMEQHVNASLFKISHLITVSKLTAHTTSAQPWAKTTFVNISTPMMMMVMVF